MLVVGNVLPWRCVGRVKHAVTPDSGAEILRRRPDPQLHKVGFPGHMVRVRGLRQPQPEGLIDIRVERRRLILGPLVNGKGIPHQAAETGFPKLHTTQRPVREMLLAY